MPPEDVERNIASLFADVQNPLNRILLADALLSCGFSGRAEALIEALEGAPDRATDVGILSGKCAFLKRDYAGAIRLLKEALDNGRPRALARGLEDAARTLAACALIAGAEGDIAREAVAAQFGGDAARMFGVMRACIAGESADSAGIADHERALTLFLSLMEIVLKAREFEAFEKLLYALNHVERPNLLISLASLYENCGYRAMAAETVLRSIRELDEITPEGARILADSLGAPR
jgi:tetratricopeptide (TPR) repeat protein